MSPVAADRAGTLALVTASDARPAGPRGPYAGTAARQRHIIRVAIELFGRSGYRSTSMRDVAVAAGISDAGLRHHYRTKDDLLRAVLAMVLDDEIDALPPTATALERLERTLDLVTRNARRRTVVELFTVLSGEATSARHPAHAYFVSRYAWVTESFTALARELAAAGQLRPGVDPETFAVTLIAVLDGLQLQWLLQPATDMPLHVAGFLRSQLADGVRLRADRDERS
jgi:AcrR family transcriptional regulator